VCQSLAAQPPRFGNAIGAAQATCSWAVGHEKSVGVERCVACEI
jgi:hypothetical protein